MPNRMAVCRDSAGRLYYEYQRTTDEPPNARYERVILPPSEVLHIPDLGFDRLVGDRPIAMAKNAIGMAQACEDYGASFFANGAARRRPRTSRSHQRPSQSARVMDSDVTPHPNTAASSLHNGGIE